MKKYILTIAAAVAVLSSCGKDFLTEEPHLAQSTELTLSTFEGLDKATAGAYAPLASTNWYGANYILAFEMGTGNARRWIEFSEYNSGRYIDEYSINFTANSTSPLWGTAYYVISAANGVLAHIDDSGIVATDQEKDNLRAECLFLRALAHFDLVLVYAQPYNYTADASHLGVPYVKTVDSEAKPARETVAKVYEYIIEDLLAAEAAIEDGYTRSGKDYKGYVTPEAIQALLARAYLYSGDNANAIAYATKVIDSGEFELWDADELADVYTLDVPGKGGEVIFEIYNNTSSSYGTGLENVWGMTSPKQYGDCGVSNDLVEIYEDGDARLDLISPDSKGNALFTLKYAGKGLGSVDANNVIVLRLSEMYLIRAEASIRSVGADTYGDLAALAEKRNATAPASTLAGVFSERRKEFCWEGHYWFDLARYGQGMHRDDVSGTAIQDLDPGDYRWAKPIAAREFVTNPNLIQNDGYNKQ